MLKKFLFHCFGTKGFQLFTLCSLEVLKTGGAGGPSICFYTRLCFNSEECMCGACGYNCVLGKIVIATLYRVFSVSMKWINNERLSCLFDDFWPSMKHSTFWNLIFLDLSYYSRRAGRIVISLLCGKFLLLSERINKVRWDIALSCLCQGWTVILAKYIYSFVVLFNW